ncbi:MAG: RES family NAD+ phosphorylase [Desulfuromonadaceae bacterium]
MLLYRVTTHVFARDLSGRGAQLYGGRWNPKGVAALYTAETPAQALLEFLPHFPDTCPPHALVLVTITAPDNLYIEEMSKNDLPSDWDAKPPGVLTVRIGRDWLIAGETTALRVPSVMLPFGMAWNLVLNPLHPQFSELTVIEVVPFAADPRLKTAAA